MTDFTGPIKTLFTSDTTLSGYATGGIITIDDVGRLGITRTSYPTGFTNGIIKPTILIKQRTTQPFNSGMIVDEVAQYRSVRCIVECWLYEYTGYTNIGLMRERIYTLLQNYVFSTGGHVLYNFEVREQRDPHIDASVERIDYDVIYLKKGI